MIAAMWAALLPIGRDLRLTPYTVYWRGWRADPAMPRAIIRLPGVRQPTFHLLERQIYGQATLPWPAMTLARRQGASGGE